MKSSISQKFKSAASSSFNEKPKIDVQDRFELADQLIAKEKINVIGPNSHKPVAPENSTSPATSKVEAFVFSQNEQQIISDVMNHFLDERIIISKSETVRMAINVLKNIDFNQLKLEYEKLPKLKRGKRPSKV